MATASRRIQQSLGSITLIGPDIGFLVKKIAPEGICLAVLHPYDHDTIPRPKFSRNIMGKEASAILLPVGSHLCIGSLANITAESLFGTADRPGVNMQVVATVGTDILKSELLFEDIKKAKKTGRPLGRVRDAMQQNYALLHALQRDPSFDI